MKKSRRIPFARDCLSLFEEFYSSKPEPITKEAEEKKKEEENEEEEEEEKEKEEKREREEVEEVVIRDLPEEIFGVILSFVDFKTNWIHSVRVCKLFSVILEEENYFVAVPKTALLNPVFLSILVFRLLTSNNSSRKPQTLVKLLLLSNVDSPDGDVTFYLLHFLLSHWIFSRNLALPSDFKTAQEILSLLELVSSLLNVHPPFVKLPKYHLGLLSPNFCPSFSFGRLTRVFGIGLGIRLSCVSFSYLLLLGRLLGTA